jgi:hypothetical protein
MDSDPSKIPVEPIPFEYGLSHFAQSLVRGRPKIVAIGSSTTAGEGNIKPYPERLMSLLQAQYPNPRIAMVNQGIGGQEAPIELQRFDTDVIPEEPDLVIWQVGTNAARTRILHLPPLTKPPGPSAMDSSSCATKRRPTRHPDGPPICAGRADAG